MMRRKSKQDDSLVPKVIKEIAQELNLKEGQVKYAVQHFFQWQREAFNKLEYTKYLWNHFGTFSIIPERYQKYISSDKYKKQQPLSEDDVITPDEEINQLTNNKDNNE